MSCIVSDQNTAKIDIFQNLKKLKMSWKNIDFNCILRLKSFQALKGASNLLNFTHQNLLYVSIWPLSRQFLTDEL